MCICSYATMCPWPFDCPCPVVCGFSQALSRGPRGQVGGCPWPARAERVHMTLEHHSCNVCKGRGQRDTDNNERWHCELHYCWLTHAWIHRQQEYRKDCHLSLLPLCALHTLSLLSRESCGVLVMAKDVLHLPSVTFQLSPGICCKTAIWMLDLIEGEWLVECQLSNAASQHFC